MRQVYELSTDDMVKLIEEALDNQVDCSGAKVGGAAGSTEVTGIVDKKTGNVLSFPFDYNMNEDDFKASVKNHFLLNNG